MIQAEKLCKRYRDRRRGAIDAVRDVTFTCQPGEVFGLLGPNGAGKTTCLRMISTAIRPTGGTVRVQEHDVLREPEKVRREIGFLSANTGLYGRLTAREVLRYFGSLFNMDKPRLEARIAELSELFGMQDFLDGSCDRLSTGMKQKVNIARTVLHDPPVMVFDEPTSGLDVLTSRTIVEFIRSCRQQGKTVLFSTHIMAEAERLCDRVAVIHKGVLYFNGTLEELRARTGGDLEEAFVELIGGAAPEELEP